MLIYIFILAGMGSLVAERSSIQGFFYDPSLFFVNGGNEKVGAKTMRIPGMVTAIGWDMCDAYEVKPLQTIYCYNTPSPSDWGLLVRVYHQKLHRHNP